jgi:hypothetical protein
VDKLGRAMVLAVSRRPLTVEARAQSLASLFVDNSEISCAGTGFTVSTSVFPCQHYSTGPPCLFSHLLPTLCCPSNWQCRLMTQVQLRKNYKTRVRVKDQQSGNWLMLYRIWCIACKALNAMSSLQLLHSYKTTVGLTKSGLSFLMFVF